MLCSSFVVVVFLQVNRGCGAKSQTTLSTPNNPYHLINILFCVMLFFSLKGNFKCHLFGIRLILH